MLDYKDFEDDLKKLLPNFSDEKLREIFELRLDFWAWIIENLDTFYDFEKSNKEWYLKTNPTDEQLN